MASVVIDTNNENANNPGKQWWRKKEGRSAVGSVKNPATRIPRENPRIHRAVDRRGVRDPQFHPRCPCLDGSVERRAHVPLNSPGQFFARPGGELKGTIFEYVRARDPDVEWTRGLGSHALEWTAPCSLFIHPLSPSFLFRLLLSRLLAMLHPVHTEATSQCNARVRHVWSTMRVPTVEWRRPMYARRGQVRPAAALAFCHSSFGEEGRPEITWEEPRRNTADTWVR